MAEEKHDVPPTEGLVLLLRTVFCCGVVVICCYAVGNCVIYGGVWAYPLMIL